MSVLNDTFRWIRALRSHKYEQTRNVLFRGSPAPDDYHRDETIPAGYCCLGVLGRECGLDDIDLMEASFLDSLSFYDEAKNEARLRGLQVINYLTYDGEGYFSALNDEDQLTFEEIADVIMERYHGRA